MTTAPEPRLDAFDITARARDAYGPDGRLALPKVAHWPIRPYEVDGLRMRHVDDPVLPEPPRSGESAADCWTCKAADEEFIWSGARWRISMPAEPQSLPAVTLHPREHLDFHELDLEHGAEMGVLMVRAQRALSSIEGVGRVHVYKWGDGGAHLHVVLIARPAGMIQLKGMFLSVWMFALPPLPADQWGAMREKVAAELAASG
jgi:diadenosine tetraphosphate (Ap4A) HIT family hydrolase